MNDPRQEQQSNQGWNANSESDLEEGLNEQLQQLWTQQYQDDEWINEQMS